jgi:hypothetical protein
MMPTYFTKRNMLWLLALAITLWLTWQTHQQDAANQDKENAAPASLLSKPAIGSQLSGASPQTANQTDLEDFSLNQRNAESDMVNDLFATPKKQVQVVADTSPNKPGKPSAPPLPFEFVGMLQEQGVSKLIVNYLDDIAVLKVGDTLGGYQLTSANKIGGSMQFQFLYLPMKITQTMVVNDAN